MNTARGGLAYETQLIKALSSGGLEWVDPAALPDPAQFEDPAEVSAALERWEREGAATQRGRLRYRVNTEAAAPCPT